MDMTKQNMN